MSQDNGGNAGQNNGGNAGNDNGTTGVDGVDSAAGSTTTDQQNGGTDSGRTFTQADVDRVIAERLARERAKFGDYDDLKTKAAELDKIRDAQKTDLEKAQERIAALETENQIHKVAEVRRAAAAEAGLPAELAEFITAADPDNAREQAKRLAERVKPVEPGASFQQGARTTAQPKPSVDDWIRQSLFGR